LGKKSWWRVLPRIIGNTPDRHHRQGCARIRPKRYRPYLRYSTLWHAVRRSQRRATASASDSPVDGVASRDAGKPHAFEPPCPRDQQLVMGSAKVGCGHVPMQIDPAVLGALNQRPVEAGRCNANGVQASGMEPGKRWLTGVFKACRNRPPL